MHKISTALLIKPAELKVQELDARLLKNAGFTAAELTSAGFSPRELKSAGSTLLELAQAGLPLPVLKTARAEEVTRISVLN